MNTCVHAIEKQVCLCMCNYCTEEKHFTLMNIFSWMLNMIDIKYFDSTVLLKNVHFLNYCESVAKSPISLSPFSF